MKDILMILFHIQKKELDVITKLIDTQIQTYDGKDLLTSFLLTKIVCNIINKYKIG